MRRIGATTIATAALLAGFGMIAAVIGVGKLSTVSQPVLVLAILVVLGAATYFAIVRLLFRSRLTEALQLLRAVRTR